ncbi:transposase IS116/IS110/IS902 family protein, partial [Bifidobacterium hapali]
AERIIDDMFKAIGEQTVTVPGTDMAETIIPSIARDIKQIKDRRRNLASQVEELLNDHPLLTVLTSMPGIGARTASNILLAIGGNISNFKNAAHLAAYAGIAPITSQSGTSIKGEHPARGGNKRLKNALWQSAFVASTKHPPSIAYYKRKRGQGKHHNAAIICLARRRCDVIYSMLKNGTLYQEQTLAA